MVEVYMYGAHVHVFSNFEQDGNIYLLNLNSNVYIANMAADVNSL